MRLDSALSNEQGLSDGFVSHSVGGHVGDAPFLDGERIGSGRGEAPGSRSGGDELTTRVLGEHDRAQAMGQVETCSKQVARAIAISGVSMGATEILTLIKLLILKSRDGLTSCFVVGVG